MCNALGRYHQSIRGCSIHSRRPYPNSSDVDSEGGGGDTFQLSLVMSDFNETLEGRSDGEYLQNHTRNFSICHQSKAQVVLSAEKSI